MSYVLIDIAQDSPAWHEFRKGKIGSSHAASLMGVGFSSPLQVFEEILFETKKPTTAAMRRGKELEPIARAWVNAKLGFSFEPAVVQSNDYPNLIASLDGFCLDKMKPSILEIKCPGEQDHLTALSGEVPERYFPQLQHQMMILGVDNMLYLSFDGKDGILVEVQRDPAFCKKLLKEELAFLDRLANFDPPEPTDRDWTVIREPKALEKAARIYQIKRLMRELEEEELVLQKGLEAFLDAKRCQVGNLKAVYKTRLGNVDYKKIEVLKEMDLTPYRKPNISYWEFREA